MGEEHVVGRVPQLRAAAISRRTVIRVGGSLVLAAPVLAPGRGLARSFQATPSGEPITVTDNGAPPENQPAAVEVYEDIVARFEAAHPNITVESTSNSWDPQTFSARWAGGELEDAFLVPYTDSQGIIAWGRPADIAEYVKTGEQFGG